MIPQQLTLKNFLSYRAATLDFTGLHTACICGANGAGKSSLLEAITWSLWGNCRTATEDDIIHIGEKEARVDFIFAAQGQIYRVIRTRQRGQSASLEFQVATTAASDQGGMKFRPLTERGMRATQQKILEHLKLDYDTFINSAYLRQGRADEFMLKRPTERKEILASLLKLDQYDKLSEHAKETARQFKAQAEVLQQTLESSQGQLQQRDEITQQAATLEATLTQLQHQQAADRQQLQQLQGQQHHRHTWEKLLMGQQQQQSHLAQECRRLQQEMAGTQRQMQELDALIQQAPQIEAGYAQFQNLQGMEEAFAAKFQAYQGAQARRQQLLDQQRHQLNTLQNQMQQVQTRLETLEQEEKEVQEVLQQRQEVEAGLAQLNAARTQLSQLDQLQLQVSPLLQQRQRLQVELDRATARLMARLDELRGSVRQLQHTYQQRHPLLSEALQGVVHQLAELDKKRVYQQRVREKGQERHHFLARLHGNQRDYEAKLAELEQKIQLLQREGGDAVATESATAAGTASGLISQFPPCPLCDRPLDEHHWNLVVQKHQMQHQDLWNHLWVVREQIAISDREISILRSEYRQLEQELAEYDELRERRGNLQAQIDGLAQDKQRLQQLAAEAAEIERSLQAGDYVAALNVEIQQLEQQLQRLNYSEESHALARNEEKRWRWAEIKQGQIKDAEAKLTKIQGKRPELAGHIAALQQQLEQQTTDSELQRQIAAMEQQIQEIGYNLEEHNRIRQEVRKAQFWLTRAEKLQSAQRQYPQEQQRTQELAGLMELRHQDLQVIIRQIETLNQQMAETPDASEQIAALEEKIQQCRQELDQKLASLGRLQQQQQHLESLQAQSAAQQQQLQAAIKQQRIYQELAQAFGKNGIQALMIENILPQLEAETNQILARLSANQLHVQFVTQRASRGSRGSSQKAVKLIDTLDILIADARGTRPYETYSGGEAFRINFAIRLALAKLLAQRAGTALQLLIIDEGFGTQDAEGCDRLIAAINAIASDFTCILTVTHIPHLKEAFQTRIEVTKMPQGSQISMLM